MDNFDLKKYLAEGRLLKEEVNYHIELLVPEVAFDVCLLYTSPSPRDLSTSRMPSSA